MTNLTRKKLEIIALGVLAVINLKFLPFGEVTELCAAVRNLQCFALQQIEAGQDTVVGPDSLKVKKDQLASDSTSVASDSVKIKFPEPDSLMRSLEKSDGHKVVSYQAERVVTLPSENRIILISHAQVKQDLRELMADTITYDYSTGNVKAVGNAIIIDQGSKVAGDSIFYNLNRDRGIMSHASTDHNEWIVYGDKFSKIGTDNLYGQSGNFTTCDLKEPHYHFATRRMKLTVNEKVIAEPVILYFKDIPVFMIPFYVFPIKKGRQSGILTPTFSFVRDQRSGRSFNNLGYYYVINDYADVTGAVDIQTNSRNTFRFEGRYAKRYSFTGQANLTIVSDQINNSTRGSLSYNHNQKLSETSDLRASLNLLTDRRLTRDFDFNIQEVLKRSIKSRVFYVKRLSWGSMDVAVNNEQFLEDEKFESLLPSFNISKNVGALFPTDRTTVGSGGQRKWYETINYGLRANIVNYRFTRNLGDTTKIADGDTVTVALGDSTVLAQAVNTNIDFNSQLKLFGWLNMSPRLNVREVFLNASSNKFEDQVENQVTYTTGVSANARFFGIFNAPRIGSITKWRHTIAPTVSYSFSPKVASVDAPVSVPGASFAAGQGVSSMSFSLENSLDAKLKKIMENGTEEEVPVQIMSLRNSLSYNFKESGLDGLGNLSSRLSSNPAKNVSISVSATHDLVDEVRNNFKPLMTNFSFNLSVRGGSMAANQKREESSLTLGEFNSDPLNTLGGGPTILAGSGDEDPFDRGFPVRGIGPWTFSIRYSLSRQRSSSVTPQSVSSSVSFNPSQNWRLSYSTNYNVNNSRFEQQSFVLHRDLHRWEATLSLVTLPEDRFRTEFSVRLKDVPEIQIPYLRQDR